LQDPDDERSRNKQWHDCGTISSGGATGVKALLLKWCQVRTKLARKIILELTYDTFGIHRKIGHFHDNRILSKSTFKIKRDIAK